MNPPQTHLNSEHTEIYDRQIRVWGFEVQQKLSSSSLMVYNLDSVNFEIAKNCILSGLSLRLFQDNSLVTENDMSINLFIKDSDIDKNKAEVNQMILSGINTLVDVTLVDDIDNCSILCFSGGLSEALRVNSICRGRNVPSYYIFKACKNVLIISDLAVDSSSGLADIINSIPNYFLRTKRRVHTMFYSFLAVIYCQMHALEIESAPQCFIARDILLEEGREILRTLGIDYIPSTTIAAGLVSQDIVTFLSKTSKTFQVLLFDGNSSIAYADELLQENSLTNQ